MRGFGIVTIGLFFVILGKTWCLAEMDCHYLSSSFCQRPDGAYITRLTEADLAGSPKWNGKGEPPLSFGQVKVLVESAAKKWLKDEFDHYVLEAISLDYQPATDGWYYSVRYVDTRLDLKKLNSTQPPLYNLTFYVLTNKRLIEPVKK